MRGLLSCLKLTRAKIPNREEQLLDATDQFSEIMSIATSPGSRGPHIAFGLKDAPEVRRHHGQRRLE